MASIGASIFKNINSIGQTLRKGLPTASRVKKWFKALAPLRKSNPAYERLATEDRPDQALRSRKVNIKELVSYEPSSSTVAEGRIDKEEVNQTMPHLLSLPSKYKEGVTNSLLATDLKTDAIEQHTRLEKADQAPTIFELEALDECINAKDIETIFDSKSSKTQFKDSDQVSYNEMMSGLDKLPTYKGEVYRDAQLDLSKMKNYSKGVGKLFTSKNFLSTSGGSNFSNRFIDDGAKKCKLRCQFIQHSGKNVSGVKDALHQLDNSLPPADDSNDGEVWLKPNTQFRLVAFSKHPKQEIYGLIFKEVDHAALSDKSRDNRPLLLPMP